MDGVVGRGCSFTVNFRAGVEEPEQIQRNFGGDLNKEYYWQQFSNPAHGTMTPSDAL